MKRVRGAVLGRRRRTVSSQSSEEHSEDRCRQDRAYELILGSLQAYQDLRQSYFRLGGFVLFASAYLLALYFQGSDLHAYAVTSSLREAIVPGSSLRSTFQSNDEMLSYISHKVVLPIWQDPVCGDDQCQWPWEYPAFGRFGCKADCGEETDTIRILVRIKANFAGRLSLSPRTLMANARWNLCLRDTDRQLRGQEDICWFVEDQSFTEVVVNQLETMEVIRGEWSVRIKGDYAGRVSGRIYDISNTTVPVQIQTQPLWKECKAQRNSEARVSIGFGRRLKELKHRVKKLNDGNEHNT